MSVAAAKKSNLRHLNTLVRCVQVSSPYREVDLSHVQEDEEEVEEQGEPGHHREEVEIHLAVGTDGSEALRSCT